MIAKAIALIGAVTLSESLPLDPPKPDAPPRPSAILYASAAEMFVRTSEPPDSRTVFIIPGSSGMNATEKTFSASARQSFN